MYTRSGCSIPSFRVRHVKCDETFPRCHRCTSTGRVCDGYIYSELSSPAAAATSGCVIVVPNTMALALRSAGPSDGIQECRSFDFFRTETFPGIGGLFETSTWKLVLQACDKEPTVRQAAIALGALHEKMSLQSTCGDGSNQLETAFPIKQYGKALAAIRKYLTVEKAPKVDVILMCALICISIEVMQNNYLNASVHLENSLQFLQARPSHNNLSNTDIDSDMSRTFRHLDLHASKFQGMRPPVVVPENEFHMPSRFSSITQAKDALASITAQLYTFVRSVAEEYKYRKLQAVPFSEVSNLGLIRDRFNAWKDRFDKFLHRSTSKFSRHEQSFIDVLIINHRSDYIEAATCIQAEALAFDEFDDEFDEIVTLAANVIRSRRQSNVLEFRLDIGIICPLYCTAVRCREPWIRQRAMSLLRSIRFQEGVWNAAAQANIAQISIDRELTFDGHSIPSQRPLEFARVHSVGCEIFDPLKRVAEVHLTQKLNGLDEPWHDHVEWCSW